REQDHADGHDLAFLIAEFRRRFDYNLRFYEFADGVHQEKQNGQSRKNIPRPHTFCSFHIFSPKRRQRLSAPECRSCAFSALPEPLCPLFPDPDRKRVRAGSLVSPATKRRIYPSPIRTDFL